MFRGYDQIVVRRLIAILYRWQ